MLHIPNAMVAPSAEHWPPQELALPTKYELDPFQKHAVLGIHAGDHVFVTAKTGSGKTFVGEYLIAHCLARGQRVFYTTPIKSLSNQKYHDLKKLFSGATVGILTGDIKMCPDAQIVVMTAEILRNLFIKLGTATEGVGLTAAVSLEGVGGIVMDEVHYIQDPDRGHVWEETLVLAKGAVEKGLKLVLLSATLPSAESLAGWLATLHQHRTVLLSTTYRIVPLVHGVLNADMTVMPLLRTDGTWINDSYAGWLRDRKSVADAALAYKKAVDARARDGYAGAPPSGKVRVEDPVSRFHRMLAWLGESKQLPALFFIFSRRECERYAALVTGSLLDSSEAAAATHIIDFHLSRFRGTLGQSPQYHAIRGLLIRGIAFHHSGLQPLLKEIVEILFSRGYVRALFATETFSVGLNMPTKTVVFLELEKFCDGNAGKRLLRPDEYIQMAGRAGRRGLDTQGLVLYEPMRVPVEIGELRGLLTGALPPLQSRMRFHYDFILKNRLTSGIDIVNQSYWAQQQRDLRASVGKDITRLEARIATLAALISPAEEQALTEKAALEAEVAGSVNAKRKKAVAALNRWTLANDEKRLPADTFKELAVVRAEAVSLTAQTERWDAAPLLSVEPLEACLREWGFLSHETALTTLGLCASETAESHLILMPLLAASGRCDDLTATEVACVLAGFLQEGGDESTIEDTGLSHEAKEVLYWIGDQRRACLATEDRYGVASPTAFWKLTPLWVSVVAASLGGATLSEIAATHGLFEGNIQRALLRVANIADEWSAIATIRCDLTMLEKMRSLRIGEITDSLYLHL